MIARGAEELDGVKAIQLRGQGIGYAYNDYIVSFVRFAEKCAAIAVVQMHARIKGCGACGKEFIGHAQHGGVQLDQIDAFDGGMAERLRNAAIRAAADEQNALGRGMLQQRIVNRFLGGAFISARWPG